MMSNRNSDPLFQLILTLTKAEKRNFKLYINRNSANADLKITELFDAIDKLSDYDETQLLKKLSSIKKPQLANAKAHLYKQILASLRVIKTNESIDLNLHEQLDYARILYNKGLFLQSLKTLEKVKEVASQYNQDSILIQAISLEKKIETLQITRSAPGKAEELAALAINVHEKRLLITRLSNMAMQMYNWYVRYGNARNKDEEKDITEYFQKNFPAEARDSKGFYERLYSFQCNVWFNFIKQNYLYYYKNAHNWVELFRENKSMIEVETAHYIKGMHNLLTGLHNLRYHKKFEIALSEFEEFASSPIASANYHNEIQTFIYLNTARLNSYTAKGAFKAAVKRMPELTEKLEAYEVFLDKHRVLVFNYKIAIIYFGAGQYGAAIDYLRKIINDTVDLRLDLQCYARLLHLLAHYEMGNYDLMEHLTKSVYRFLVRMENLSSIEKEMLKFFRSNFSTSPRMLQSKFREFLEVIKKYENDRFETRSFAYLDIISWIESKINKKPLSEVIHDRFLESYNARQKTVVMD